MGFYRWLILSVTAYLLAHWTYLAQYYPHTLDWGQAAFLALSTFFPILLLSLLLLSLTKDSSTLEKNTPSSKKGIASTNRLRNIVKPLFS